MHIACGPFTPDGDLLYRQFHELVARLKAAKPAVVLLVRCFLTSRHCNLSSTHQELQLGPFIDANHPSIKIGDVDSAPEDMFRTVFLDRLRDFLDSSPGSLVLLLPSPRDILSEHAVLPQPELPSTLRDRHPVRPTRFLCLYFAISLD